MEIHFNKLIMRDLNPQTLFEKQVRDFIQEWFSSGSEVDVQTSGSTGSPKIFQISKDKMLNSAKMTCDFLKLEEGDTALICLPVKYISGKMMVVRSIERKFRLILREPSINPLKDLNEYISFCAMTPLQVENSLDKIHLIKNLIIGGAAVAENLKNKIKSQLQNSEHHCKIYETYGMSETLSHIALKEIFPNTQNFFTVLNGIEISTDDRGRLQIFAPDLNSEKLITNDLVEIINNHQFRFLGRTDCVINSGGAKIFPEQLEAFVKSYIDNEVVFIGIPDEQLGERLFIVVEGKESEYMRSEILNLNYQKSYHKPKGIIFVEELPRTPNGKIDRLKIRSIIQN